MRILLICLASLSLACQTKVEETESTTDQTTVTDKPVSTEPAVETGSSTDECYQRVMKRDTATMRLTIRGNNVSGTLVYDNYEKDSSHGTVSGKKNNDTIIVWYTFQSEGMQSVRESIFKINGDQLSEATGDIEMHGDSVYFKDRAALKFSEIPPFKKIACTN